MIKLALNDRHRYRHSYGANTVRLWAFLILRLPCRIRDCRSAAMKLIAMGTRMRKNEKAHNLNWCSPPIDYGRYLSDHQRKLDHGLSSTVRVAVGFLCRATSAHSIMMQPGPGCTRLRAF